MNASKQKILDVMATVFEINQANIPDNAAPGIIEAWDSLRHMNLIISLEEEFCVRFTDEEMTELISLPLIIDILKAKKGDQE